MSALKRFGLTLLVASIFILACRFSVELPWNIGAEDVAISPDDVSAAATRAAALADRAGQLAATAVLQGDEIVSTAVAGEGLPDLGAAAAAVGSLQKKLQTFTPDANGNFTVTITEADLAEYLAVQGDIFANNEGRIENVRVNLTPQHVVVNGDLTEPVTMPLTVELRPLVTDGRPHFQVIKASAGLLPVPDSLSSILETGINVGLGQAMSALPDDVTLLDVALGPGSMTFLGHVE